MIEEYDFYTLEMENGSIFVFRTKQAAEDYLKDCLDDALFLKGCRFGSRII